MMVSQFPGCCTAKIIKGLEGIPTSFHRTAPVVTKEELQNLVDELVYEGEGMIVAMTTDTQKNANKVLKDFGFKRTKSASKREHPETKIILWWYPLEE